MADVTVKTNLVAVVAPVVTDDTNAGYSVFSPWVDVTGDQIYFAVDVTAGAAVWRRVSGLVNIVEDLTPQLGGMLDVNGQAIGDGTLELITFTEVPAAINQIDIGNNSIGLGPTISATGDDVDVAINLAPKGTMPVAIGGVTPVAGTKLLLPQENDAVTPTLAFGAGEDGFFSAGVNTLNLVTNGLTRVFCGNGSIASNNAFGFRLNYAAGTTTIPNYTFASDTNTGFSRPEADQLSFITQGVEAINISATQGVSMNPGASTVGLTMTMDATPGDAIVIQDSGASTVFNVNSTGNVLLADGTAAAPSVAFLSDTDIGFRIATPGGIFFATANADRIQFGGGGIILRSGGTYGFTNNASSPIGTQDVLLARAAAGRLTVKNSTTVAAEIGQDGIGIANVTEGGTARLTRRTAHETHTLANANTSDTTTISIPSGARLLGVSFNVDAVIVDDAGDDTWSAAYITGSTQTIISGAAAALNTKVDQFHAIYEISTGICQIRFTANGGNFTAGSIEIVAYYEDLTSLANQ